MEIIVGYLFGVLCFKCMLCVLIKIASILMSTHSIHLQNKRRKSPYIIRISYLEEIPTTQERVRLIHGKRAIGVRATEVLLYYLLNSFHNKAWSTLST